MWAGCVVLQRPKGKSAVMNNVCKSEQGAEGGSESKEMGGGARSCLLRFCPTLPIPRVFFYFTRADIGVFILCLKCCSCVAFLAFLLSCAAFEGYRTGRRDRNLYSL